MLALAVVFAVGVKVAVRVSPVPLMALRVPPVTTTSPLVPSQANPVGSSLNVNVMTAVWPVFNALWLLVMVTVGASASMVNEVIAAAAPLLPAASV